MILLVQREKQPNRAQLVARLLQGGHSVAIAHGDAEGRDLVFELRPTLVVLDEPRVERCPDVFCAWVQDALGTPPALLGLVDVAEPALRERCEACMTLLPPDTAPRLSAATATTILQA